MLTVRGFKNFYRDETVVLLGREKVDGYIDIDLDVSKLEGKTGTATYPQIKDYIMKKYGLKVSGLYIGQIKGTPSRTRLFSGSSAV
jgi:hypothetical protein